MSQSREHAIVIGGSMAGLVAARTLTDHFARVTLLERDQLPQGAELRNGTPQARHLHTLLARGLRILEELFPGITLELDKEGALPLQWGKETSLLLASGWTPRFDSSVHARTVSRQTLEWVVRRRILQNPCIQIIDHTQVEKLLTSPDQSRVTGVVIQGRDAAHETRELNADWVVDASGRSSHAAEWLESLGYERPKDTEVNANLGYATRWYKRLPSFDTTIKSLAIQTRPPQNLRGGGFMEVENGQWIVTLVGINGDYPPNDEAGFMEFTRSLAAPDLYNAIKDAEPLSGISGYQRTSNRRRHFENLQRWPEQFVVLGDAACAFNPVYGQGMSLGAMSALTLRDTLADSSVQGNVAHEFQKRLAKLVEAPWLMATGEDLRYPGTVGDKPGRMDRILQRYIDQVIHIIPKNPEILDVFFQVMNLLKPPTALFSPSIVLKVAASLFRG